EPALPLALDPTAVADTAADAAPVDSAEPVPQAFALPASAPALVRAPPPLLAAPLPTPDLRGDAFETQFGAQLEWMAGQKISHARIRVTPNDLGPVEVRLQLDGDRIAADFVSAHAETRQMLEQGLPRLRELLGESGFQLAHAGVGNGGGQGDRNPSSSPATGVAGAGAEDGAPSQAPLPPVLRTIGLLDAYA
uniref:flagellar hook-length control protein FliK n=1 Tax=Luteimonas TaxID=83614 RepID=UPI00117E444A